MFGPSIAACPDKNMGSTQAFTGRGAVPREGADRSDGTSRVDQDDIKVPVERPVLEGIVQDQDVCAEMPMAARPVRRRLGPVRTELPAGSGRSGPAHPSLRQGMRMRFPSEIVLTGLSRGRRSRGSGPRVYASFLGEALRGGSPAASSRCRPTTRFPTLIIGQGSFSCRKSPRS